MADRSKIALSAAWARNLIIRNKLLHFFIAPAIHRTIQCQIMLCRVIFDDFIRTKTLMAFPAVHQRIREPADMAGCFPCFWIHQDRAVYADIIRAFLHEFLPPGSFDIVLQFYAQVSVIPGIG